MKRNRLAALILIAATAGAAWRTSPLAGQSNPNERQAQAALQAAMNKETVDGNLDAAIQQYKTIISKYPGERAVVAGALIHMAECYQKLGDAQAQKIYEQVVRDYSDQQAAVTFARGHMGGAGTVSSGKGDRAVWTGADLDDTGMVSPDGRSISFVDWNNGSLMLHDLASNGDRVLTPPAPNYSQKAMASVISRDGKQIVYIWSTGDNAHTGFRIAALRGSGLLEPRDVVRLDDGVRSIGSFDLSPDGKWLASGIKRKDGTTQIALITVADGSLKVLKSIDGNVKSSMFFSFDSRFLAYSLPAGQEIDKHDVFVLAIDGSRETSAVVSAAREIMGWSPDGTRLLFSSDRTGSVGLWALPFADGKAQGAPELIKSDIGPSSSLGLTAAGALYVWKAINSRDVALAPVDLETGKFIGPAVGFTQGFLEGMGDAYAPMWSPDGNYLAYSACYTACIAIRTVATGQVRRLPRTMTHMNAMIWSPDGRSLLTRGVDLSARTGFFKIDAQTGETTLVTLVSNDVPPTQMHWSRDGKIMVHFTRGGAYVEWDLVSGKERNLDGMVNARFVGPLSPDGQYFARIIDDQATKTANLILVPNAGGQSRQLLSLSPPETFGFTLWTGDSSAVVIRKDTPSGSELWLVPTTGGSPRKLNIDPNVWLEGNAGARFSLSPDGRSIAFWIGKTSTEIWALENFLRPQKVNK